MTCFFHRDISRLMHHVYIPYPKPTLERSPPRRLQTHNFRLQRNNRSIDFEESDTQRIARGKPASLSSPLPFTMFRREYELGRRLKNFDDLLHYGYQACFTLLV